MRIQLAAICEALSKRLEDVKERTVSPEIERNFESRTRLVAFAITRSLIAVLVIATFVRVAGAATVTLLPGTNIQAAVNSYPAGTTFTLKSGVYRMQSIVPRGGDKFIGEAGADLNGSQVVTNWVKSGRFWVSSGNTALTTPYGPASTYCQASNGCAYPQDLYLNNRPLVHQLALPVTTGHWYFDYGNGLLYMADNPSGQTVELSVKKYAFGGSANNVTVQNLIVEKYAVLLQSGAIEPYGSGWTIKSNEVRLNHGEGIKTKGNNETILSNNVHNNGEAGIASGGGSNILYQYNTVSSNNYAKVTYVTEAGGSKFAGSSNLHILNNAFSGNDGVGLWVDADCNGATISGNTVTNNTLDGIRYEYSHHGTISGNVLRNNGQSASGGCTMTRNAREIVLSDSDYTTVTGNTLTSNCGGITLTHGTHRLPLVVPVDDIVTDNTITYSGSTTITNRIGGLDGQTPPLMFNGANNNYFDYNTYHFASNGLLNMDHWLWGGTYGINQKLRDWAQWRAAGQDIHGTAN
jgi:parallel beta-helix repeat protein